MQPRSALLTLLALAAPALVHCSSSSQDAAAPAGPAPVADSGPADAGVLDATPDQEAAAPAPPLAHMAVARSLFAAVNGKDGRIRTFAGLTPKGLDDGAETYDPIANTWTQSPAQASVGRYGHAATADATGHVYVVGGTNDGQSPIGNVDLYSPADDSWKTLADLPTPRLGLGAATSKDGHVYAIGGRGTDGAPSDVVEVYAPDTQTWSKGPSLPTKRLALVAVTGADGKIYAIGGRDAQTTPLAVVEAFDPAKGTWETVQPLGTARYWFGATLGADGKIYALGGVGDLGFLDDIEAFTPGVGWKAMRAMPVPRAWVSAGASADGRVFAIGGASPLDDPSTQPPPVRTIVALDPKTNTWTK